MSSTSPATVARLLLEVEALRFSPDAPFDLSDGGRSPLVVDARGIISYPRLRRRLVAIAVARLEEACGTESFDAIAGAETAGLPMAAWLADALMLPMLYVRKKPKGFGRNAAIEGRLTEGARVLLVDDVITTGSSKLLFADALREAGGRVEHVLAICAAGIWPATDRALEEAGLHLHALATWRDLAAVARAHACLPADLLDEIDGFLAAPQSWRFEAPTG